MPRRHFRQSGADRPVDASATPVAEMTRSSGGVRSIKTLVGIRMRSAGRDNGDYGASGGVRGSDAGNRGRQVKLSTAFPNFEINILLGVVLSHAFCAISGLCTRTAVEKHAVCLIGRLTCAPQSRSAAYGPSRTKPRECVRVGSSTLDGPVQPARRHSDPKRS